MKTGPEAAKNALKIRGASDWFGHVDSPVSKNKLYYTDSKQPELWFAQTAEPKVENVNARPRTAGRGVRTPEAECIKQKIKGSKESWYKHEENTSYANATKSRIRSNDASIYKSRNSARESMEWFKSSPNSEIIQKSPRTPSQQSETNLTKQRPSGIPNWYKCEQNQNYLADRPVSRCTSRDAKDNLKKNRIANDWISPDAEITHFIEPNFRIKSPEAIKFAQNLKKDSENWFQHDENNNVSEKLNEVIPNGIHNCNGNDNENSRGVTDSIDILTISHKDDTVIVKNAH